MRRYSGKAMQVRQMAVLIAVAAGTLAAAGCSSTGPKTGSLTVTIIAPAGVTPAVTVSGPNAYSKVLAATTTLTGLAVGNYTVTAASVTTTAPIVGTVNTGTVSGSPASVTANATAAATAAYTQRPGTGGLWIGNQAAPTVVEYSAAQLASTTSAAATTAIGTGGTGPLNDGVVFDGNGNLWVAQFSSNVILEFTASQLASSGTPTAAVTLATNAGSLNAPVGMAFDANGNLWVANYSDSLVVQFSASQLASSGSPAPAIVLSWVAKNFNFSVGLAFDAHGNLWVVNSADSTLVEFTPSSLAASGSPTPTVTISPNSGSLVAPLFIAFDSSGNLWVTNGSINTIVAFSPSQLAATGRPAPAVTLSATAGSLVFPGGLAFDASGNLWVANINNNTVVEFTASQLRTSGSPTPNVIVSGTSLSQPVGIAFNPHAANLPFRQ
jgi:sugar lactone lactonase YvrE